MLRKLVGYAAYMFGANTFTAFLTFAVSALGAATRSKEAFGYYALYMLIYEIGNSLCISGVNATIQKLSADSHENRIRFARIAYRLFIVLSAVGAAGALIAGQYVPFHLTLGFLGIPWVVVHWWSRYIVRSNFDMKREARYMVVASLGNSVFRFLFLTFTDLEHAMIYGDFLALVASGIVPMFSLPRALGVPLRTILRTPVPREFVAECYTFIRPLWFAGLVFLARHEIQKIWTTADLGAKALGAFQFMITLWQFVAKPMDYFSQATLPGLVKAGEERHRLYREILRISLLSMPLIAIVAASGVPLLFHVIDWIQTNLGRTDLPMAEKYAEVPLMMMLGALAVAFAALEMVANQYAIAEGRQRAVFYAQTVNVVVMLALLYPLATAHGVYGVIIAGVVGEAANALTYVILMYRSHRGSMRSSIFWTALSIAWTGLSLLPVYHLLGWRWVWVMTVPAALIYVAGMFASRMLLIDDFVRLSRALRGRSQAAA